MDSPPCSNKERRTHAERRAVLSALLADPIWQERSTSWLAAEAGTSWYLADRVRTELDKLNPDIKRQSLNGKRYPTTLGRKFEG